MSITTGNRIGRYEVLARLGAGGMGEVYKVYDTTLDRPVALKILPADLVEDEDRLRRFIQEARSASGLNHPHIVTIYEIGQVEPEEIGGGDGGAGVAVGSGTIHYIAMEFIDGDTLRARIHRDRTDLKRLLDFLAQVADGLSKAHAAGIVHRDLKPDNIMITPDSYAKILDFGLAKLVKPRSATTGDGTEAATALMEYTQPGIVMGTLGYMSPEQVQSKAVDHRSDIFSFGCILYEAATGRKPFDGDSLIDTLHKIVYAQAAPLKELNPDAPVELQRIIRKCLAKDPEERYQSIKEVAIDLRDLIREYDSQPMVSGLYFASTSYASMPPVSSGVAVPAQKGDRKSLWITFSIIALLLICAGAFSLYKMVTHKQARLRVAVPFEQMKFTRLTTSGSAAGAAISPDGKYLAHVVDEAGKRSLSIRQVATNSNVQIVPPADIQFSGLTFSPDGNYVYYVLVEKTAAAWTLFRVPTLGGDPRRMLVDIDSVPSFSPDGKQLAFVRHNVKNEETVLIAVSLDGLAERNIAVRKSPGSFYLAAWSPDGKIIVCSERGASSGVYESLVEVRVEDGQERPFTSQKWIGVSAIKWLSDQSGLIVSAQDQNTGWQMWQINYPSGEARRITNDLNNYFGASLTADSKNLVTLQRDRLSNIWIAPSGDASRAVRITTGVGKHNLICWTPDGRVVYGDSSTGEPRIWIMNADGTGRKQLTPEGVSALWPTVSADGRYIVFQRLVDGSFNIWRMDIDGGNLKQLTSGSLDGYPHCSPAGQWVVYSRFDTGRSTVWKVSIEGGEPVQLTDKYSSFPVVSPNGRFVVCHYWNEQLESRDTVAIVPIEGGQPVKTFAIALQGAGLVRWSADGRALHYLDSRNGMTNIWSQPIAGGQARQVTNFKSDRLFRFDWSRDGKQLLSTRGTVTSDVVLMTESR
jgi:eukaryotic-like serine/threonine-protein kinase